MWNAMHSKSLVGAVLITATIHGSLLWEMNNMATEGTSSKPQMTASSLLATPTEARPQARPQTRYVTLEPVVVVGRRFESTVEPSTARASGLTPDAPEADRPSAQVVAYIW